MRNFLLGYLAALVMVGAGSAAIWQLPPFWAALIDVLVLGVGGSTLAACVTAKPVLPVLRRMQLAIWSGLAVGASLGSLLMLVALNRL